MVRRTIPRDIPVAIDKYINSAYDKVIIVADNIETVKSLADVADSIGTLNDNLNQIVIVSDNIANVNVVAGISDNIVVVADIANNVVSVSDNIDDINRLVLSISEVERVSQSADNVDRLYASITNLDRLYASIDNVDTVIGHISEIDTIATNITDVTTVAANIASVVTVATNIAVVVNVSTNMADVLQASVFVDDIHTSVDAAAASASASQTSANESEQSNLESANNAAITAADKADVTAMRDEVEADRGEVELNTAQVAADTLLVAADKATTEGYRDEAEAARLEGQRWATGISGSGIAVPSDTNNAFYYSEVARNNANQTFKSGGYFTPTLGQEYPDVTDVEVDTIWLVKFATVGETYTFTTGDMVGEEVSNGYMIVYDTPANTFNFIPTTLSGASSINGITPDGAGNITITGNDISDVFTESEVLAITNALASRVTALENTTTDHETRIVDLETQQAINKDDITTLQTNVSNNDADILALQTQQATNTSDITALGGRADAVDISLDDHESRISTNETDIATKQDAATAATRVEGNAIEVPSVATADRITTGSTALFSFNPTTGEAELYNPITGETGSVGGGGVSPIERVSADFIVTNKKIYGIDLETNALSFINATVPEGFGLNDWFGIADAYSLFESKLDKNCVVHISDIATNKWAWEETGLDPDFIHYQRNAVYIFQVVKVVGSVKYWNVTQSSYGTDAEYVQNQIELSQQAYSQSVANEIGDANDVIFTRVGNTVTVKWNPATASTQATGTTLVNIPVGYAPVQSQIGAKYPSNRNADASSVVALSWVLGAANLTAEGWSTINTVPSFHATWLTTDAYPTGDEI